MRYMYNIMLFMICGIYNMHIVANLLCNFTAVLLIRSWIACISIGPPPSCPN